ncbi:MAG: SPOR domain-containing protein, partial [Myxococcota bacterium]|nr:SPOR domain-containing protein [Myxococcota bacterium]
TFSLGMMVGKKTAESASASPAGLTLAEIEEARSMREDLKFYRSLTEASKAVVKAPPVAAPAPEPTAPKPTVPAAAPELPKPAAGLNEPETRSQEAQPSIRSALSRLSRESPIESAPVAGGYTVQVSSFPSLEEAEAYQSTLVRKGYSPYIVSANLPGRGTWFRVRMGHYAEKDKALDAKDALAQANIPGWVLSID